MAGDRRLYFCWRDAKRRCTDERNEKYPQYGGRGITMCPEWLNSFESFKNWAYENGYYDPLTLDRIDNDKGYSPKNCRWSTRQVQDRNKTTTRRITVRGVEMCLTDWASIIGQSVRSITIAEQRGTPPEEYIEKRLGKGEKKWKLRNSKTQSQNDSSKQSET